MLFVDDSTNLNVVTFNEDIGYHLPDLESYIRRLQSEIRGSIYRIEMIRDRIGVDLEFAIAFQKSYAQNVCVALESCFADNGIINVFKILNPSNMSTRQVGLAN